MAYVVFRRKSRKVYVYYADPKDGGKVKQLDRDKTKHLDGKPVDHIHKWVGDWEREQGRLKDHVKRTTLRDGDPVVKLWKQYVEQQDARRDVPRRKRTVRTEHDYFHQYVVEFFVGKHQRKDPATWHDLISPFHLHLASECGLAARSRRQVLLALARFGKYLVFTQYMAFPFVVQLPRDKKAQVTPLKVRKSPAEIIKFVKEASYKYEKIDFNLAILLGYFGALGPSELYALSKEDFITGAIVEDKCSTLEGFRKRKLGSKLAVVVSKTLPNDKDAEPIPLMKNDYRYGVVNIWHKEAAQLIANILKTKKPGRLFPLSYSWLVHKWKKEVFPRLQATNHDLRRASALYLGRTLRIETTLLQEHMRHADLDTTQLYMRDPLVPDADELRAAKQNFDDVA